MPFVSGTGFKNKLLEAASLGMPIICSRRACAELRQAAPEAVGGVNAADCDGAVAAFNFGDDRVALGNHISGGAGQEDIGERSHRHAREERESAGPGLGRNDQVAWARRVAV